MTIEQVVYILKQNYTFTSIGRLFGFSPQRAHEIYWRYWRKIKRQDNRYCDLCGKKSPTTAWRESEWKLCWKCWKEINRLFTAPKSKGGRPRKIKRSKP